MNNSLTDVIRGVIERSADQDQMKPTWVANAAYLELDPERVTPIRVKIAAMEELKDMARAELRGHFQPNDDADALQHELWPNLQQRYPTAHASSDGEPTYVKLELLNTDDVMWNVARLRAEADTKLKHANALEQWARERHLLAA